MIWKSSTSYRARGWGGGDEGGTSQPLHTCRARLMPAARVIRRELDEREREREGWEWRGKWEVAVGGGGEEEGWK